MSIQSLPTINILINRPNILQYLLKIKKITNIITKYYFPLFLTKEILLNGKNLFC